MLTNKQISLQISLMMSDTIQSALIEWFYTNELRKDEQILYISEHGHFDVTCQVRYKVVNVSNFKSVGPGSNSIKQLWRNDNAFWKADWVEGKSLFLRV